MQVAILGPAELRDGDRAVPVAGARLRRLLVRLAADVGRTVSPAELADAVWEGDGPADVTNALQTLVSRLRRALGDPGLLRQVPGGYRLVLDEQDVDAFRFTTLAGQGRAALAADDPRRAAELLREALALWRGPALQDAGDAEYALAWSSRWEEHRLDAVCQRIAADLRLGRAAEVVAELEELRRTHPLREDLVVQLMAALVATGRPAEALAAYEQVREMLADQLGTDPSAGLQAQHLQVLRGQAEPVPAPSAARRRRTNLRSPLTSFIGRDDDVLRIDELLGRGRLTTIVGPGGAGKTRLSVEVGTRWLERVDDGVWFVPLAPVTDEADIGPTVLGSLGLRESNLLERRPERLARDATDRLLESLGDAQALLVVDNCEHLIGGAAAVVDKLLANCPRLRVLATSREPLGLDGESLWSVSSLGLPEEGATAAEALTHPAVQLLAERGAAIRPDFVVDQRTIGAAIEIVRRLDGLPLAIELAAARLRVLPVAEVAARLSDRFALLTGGKRTALPRHRTLRAVVQWSWDLLSADERLLAERLAVFPAGASVESAQSVCAGARLADAALPELLSSLVDKSLLQVDGDGALRYRMLETIREFGVERLVERGEVEQVRRAHAEHFRDLVGRAEPHLRTREQLPWLGLLRRERDNILAAVRFLGDSGDAAATVDLVLRLGWYWTLIGSHGEAVTWLTYALGVPGEVDADRRAVAEAALAVNSLASGAREEVSEEVASSHWHELNARLEGVELHQDPLVVMLRPMLAFFTGDLAKVDGYFAEALSFDDPWVRASARMFRVHLAENAGHVEEMRENLEVALEEFTRIGDRWGLATALGSRGQLRTLDGDLTGALADYEQAVAYLDELGANDDSDMVRLRMLAVRVRLGDLDGARREAGRVEEDAVNRPAGERLFVHLVLAGIAQASGDRDALRRLRARAEELLDRERSWNPMLGHARALLLPVIAGSEIEDGELDRAAEYLGLAHEAAVGTRDMPIVSVVGVVVAQLALALGRPEDAAELLGAAARLRGSDDLTDLVIKRLRSALGEALGEGFDPAYERGRCLDRDAAIARLDPAGLGEPGRVEPDDLRAAPSSPVHARRR